MPTDRPTFEERAKATKDAVASETFDAVGQNYTTFEAQRERKVKKPSPRMSYAQSRLKDVSP